MTAPRTVDDLTLEELREWIAAWCHTERLAAALPFKSDHLALFEHEVRENDHDPSWWDLECDLLDAYEARLAEEKQ